MLLAPPACVKAQDSLQPWKITRLTTSGLPYRSEAACHDPLNTIAVEIQDPNVYLGLNSTGPEIQITQCIAKFPYCSPPYHQPFNCTDIPSLHGMWSFTFFPTNEGADTKFWNPGQNFSLSFQLLLPQAGDRRRHTGQASFSVWENLRGLCSAGGVCSFSLREEVAPVSIPVE
ncbi:hypothetical protein B0T14DRAFT_434134 [Immersiella caudata]|uniref:Uncharacterized protein n=1 Tax=Immersiella caudata TaxID=314043 RepID=A0AA39WLB7_9PEZI|nr:hypothetical protein B0T14DRAFT_434134 [Immersiella caudata]